MDLESFQLQLDDANKMPSYDVFLKRMWLSFYEFTFQWNKYPVQWDFILATLRYVRENLDDIFLILGAAIFFTLARYLFTRFYLKPKIQSMRLEASNAEKFPEAAWRFILYSGLWFLSIYYIFFSGEVDYYEKPCTMFQNITVYPGFFHQKVPPLVTLIYILQSAFYLHSTFATLFMDYIRSDFMAMMLHHGVTSSLLILSYFMKFYKVGILVLYVHDATDILMEFAKLNVYLKYRGGQVHMIHEYLANLGFTLFVLAWVYFRLYLYPLKVLHATTWCVFLLHKDREPRLFNLFNGLLFFLQAIHIYWFYFIMRIALRMVTGQMKEIDDIREKEEEIEMTKRKKSKNLKLKVASKVH